MRDRTGMRSRNERFLKRRLRGDRMKGNWEKAM